MASHKAIIAAQALALTALHTGFHRPEARATGEKLGRHTVIVLVSRRT